MSVDLVICHYRDNLDWLTPLVCPGVRVLVQDKWDGAYRAPYPGAVKRPNVGMCDEAYAHHIVTHYDDLADWTLFTPDGPHDHLPEGMGLADCLTPGDCLRVPRMWKGRDWGPDGRLSWACWGSLPKRGGTSWKAHYESGKVTPAKLPFVEWARRYAGYDPDGTDWPGYAPGGIYGVPRRAIAYLPRAFYERLREQLSHAVEPEEAHYAERLWPVVWSGRACFVPEAVTA